MAIQALPDTTVRAIGATQVLTDPAALIKELVDNALDAHATSISVEIHHNTLDTVQVRDNGHGIAPEDRPLAAKRYCTSKLANYDDLKDIGGSSLGFRGEALASAAELSGSLTISTRVEGEQVGATLKINQKGEVVSQEKASLPVGTCVKITDFIKANPVRRQVALKNTDACLKKIKRCLQAYAFARPHVRYSLRVLKSKTAKGDWVYAPKANGNAEDAAIKLVGSACASQCLWSVLEHEGFSFQAFLPRPDADASKIGGFGSFISVDARPVSSIRGHFKQIVKAYREALKGAGSQFEDVKEPFLHLEISCPEEAYDINVEPAKDDVAFEDSAKVIQGVKKLFGAVYERTEAPEPDERATTNVIDQMSTTEDIPHQSMVPEFEPSMMLQQDVPVDAMSGGLGNESLPEEAQASFADLEDGQPAGEPGRRFRTNMYGCDEEDLELLDGQPVEDRTLATLQELRAARKDVTVSNPWVLAKLNSSSKRAELPQPREADEHTGANVLSSPSKQRPAVLDMEEPMLPTPRPSSPSPPVERFHPSDHVPNMRVARNGNLVNLPPPQMYTPMPSSEMPIPEPEDFGMMHEERRQNISYGSSPRVIDLSSGPPQGAIPDFNTRPRQSPKKQNQQSRANKPFVSPVKDQAPREKVWFDHLENIENRQWRPPKPRMTHNMVSQGELGDFVEEARSLTPPRRNRDIRDFVGARNQDSVSALIESRNYPQRLDSDVTLGQENEVNTERAAPPRRHTGGPGFVRASEVADLNENFDSPEKQAPAPRKRRKTSERPALQDLSTNAPRAREAEEDEGYRPTTNRSLSRRRSSHKVGRTKSSKLPLERVPAGQAMQNLILSTSVSVHAISQLAGQIDEEHSVVGYNQPALDPDDVFSANPPDLMDLTNNLHDLLLKAGEDTNTPSPDQLYNEVQKAFSRHSASQEGDEVMSSI